MALLIVVIAYYCVRNTAQDLIYAITGRIPPSFVREQQRIARREARRPLTADRADRRFFRNAYNDAWESAEAHRARWAEKRTQKRYEKWGTQGDVPAPVQTNARPEEVLSPPAHGTSATLPEPTPETEADTPSSIVHKGDYTFVPGGKNESLYQRYAMRRRNGGQPMTTVAIADELGVSVAEADKLQQSWSDRYDQETNPDVPPKHLLDYQKHSRCRDCSGEITINKDPERSGQWIVGVNHTREDCPQDAKRPTPREQHDQQVQRLADAVPAERVLRDPTDTPAVRPVDDGDRIPEAAVIAWNAEADSHEELAKHRHEAIERERAGDHEGAAESRRRADEAAAALGVFTEEDTDAHLADTPATTPLASTSETHPPNTKENNMTVNAETTGLQSALHYTASMAATTGEGVSSVETSIASLQQGEVGESVTGHLTQAQEHLSAAQAAFQAANDELTSHINVQEAYSANPNAGNKQFVTAE
jgi:hypothetical protein